MKIGRKRIGDSVTESMNYEAVCRTALATPGLLNIIKVVETCVATLKSPQEFFF